MNQIGEAEKPYRILVAVGEPDHLMVLLAIAVPLARAHGGRVVPLYVGDSDEKPSWFSVPEERVRMLAAPSSRSQGKPTPTCCSCIGKAGPHVVAICWGAPWIP